MYAAPREISCEVFAELPDELRRAGAPSDWTRWQPGEARSHSLLEGLSFDREGRLRCVDVAFGRIFRVSAEGRFEVVAEYDGEPNGLRIHRDGRIFIADYKHGIMRLDPGSGRVEPFLTRYRVERFKGVNDLVFASNGDLYFTDQGLTGLHDPTGRLFRLTASGELQCLLDNIPSPNGLVLNMDETQVYVGVTRANAVWRVPVLPDGSVVKAGTFIQLSGGAGPDGMAMDEAGNILVCHVGLGSVWVFDPFGEAHYRIRSPRGRKTTNLAFGGADRRTLYIAEAESGCILTAQMPVAGRVLYSHL
jgi:gluconolactonase